MSMSYDYIIAGAGASGLSLLHHILSFKTLENKSILLIERDQKVANDRTWCFWETGEGHFDNCVSKTWDTLNFHAPNFSRQFDIAPFSYKMIRSGDFYDYCFRVIKDAKNVTVVQDEIVSIGGDGTVLTKKTKYKAQYVFNSVIPALVKHLNDIDFVQHFKGLFIETPTAQFDPQQATLMDFRVSQFNDCRFVYVLPTDERHALIEYTGFSRYPCTENEYDEQLKLYLNNILNIKDYTVTDSETGRIPMTTAKFSPGKNSVINIGTVGGATKASTGYTFTFIQKQSAEIAATLARTGIPVQHKGLFRKRFDWYDRVFLHALSDQRGVSYKIFEDMFKKLSPSSIFRFLNNESSLTEELQLMKSLEIKVFLKAAWAGR
jgi:lycopene beta-cyclase